MWARQPLHSPPRLLCKMDAGDGQRADEPDRAQNNEARRPCRQRGIRASGKAPLVQMADTSKPSSNVGKWDELYKELLPQDMGAFHYGDTVTYRMAAAFLADVIEVEDWGCGAGGFKRFCRARYVGLDGSKTPFADRIADLCTYTSRVEGIFMRHVLEHNYSWKQILDNAVSSFTKKLCLVLFTPFGPETREIAHNRARFVDVPDLSFCRADIEGRFAGLRWELFDNIPTDTGYGVEHVYLVWRPGQLHVDAMRNGLKGLVRRIVNRVG